MTSVLVLYGVKLTVTSSQQSGSFLACGASNPGNKTISPAFRYFDLKTVTSNHHLDFYDEDVNETADNKQKMIVLLSKYNPDFARLSAHLADSTVSLADFI